LIWAAFVLIAVRNPAAWGSFFTFTLVANVIHGAIMLPGAFEAQYHSKFLTDIPWIWLLAFGIYLLRPATRIFEPDR
jgi:hypothetical protein